MKLFNRDSIARDIEFKVFGGKTVWSLIFPNPRDGISFVSSTYVSERRLFEKMENNVKRRVTILGGELKGIYVKIKGRRRSLNYKTADELMGVVVREHLPLTFKIMVKNKYYEFVVEN